MTPLMWWRNRCALKRRKAVVEAARQCKCDGTWKAMQWVVANWVVAGIGKD